jgi:hypothetical protein
VSTSLCPLLLLLLLHAPHLLPVIALPGLVLTLDHWPATWSIVRAQFIVTGSTVLHFTHIHQCCACHAVLLCRCAALQDSWSAEEDAKLRQLHAQYGTSWSRISKCLKGRTSQQCRARWHQINNGRGRSGPPAGSSSGGSGKQQAVSQQQQQQALVVLRLSADGQHTDLHQYKFLITRSYNMQSV